MEQGLVIQLDDFLLQAGCVLLVSQFHLHPSHLDMMEFVSGVNSGWQVVGDGCVILGGLIHNYEFLT